MRTPARLVTATARFKDVAAAEHAGYDVLLDAAQIEPQNRYGLPAFYELHLWLWKPNSEGMFDDWNPKVVCP